MLDFKVNKRLVELRDALNLTQEEFAGKLGYARSTWSEYESGKRILRFDKLTQIFTTISDFADISESWFFFGKGSMIKQELALIDQVNKNPLIYGTHSDGIPVVNLETSAGLLASQTHPADEAAYYVPKFGDLRHINNAAGFEVKGMSMLPTIQSGDLIIASRVMNINDIKPNYIYVVHSSILIGETQSNIKRVVVSVDGAKLTLKSDNRIYAPITISSEELIAIWQVRRRMTGKFMNPQDFEQRLSEVEFEIQELKKNKNH